MSIIDKLATSLGHRDEAPNIALAKDIAANNDKAAVKELVELLQHKKKDIQSDSIKVLYETAEENPEIVAPYYKDFVALLGSKNNRLVWGAMTALDAITLCRTSDIYAHITTILDASDNGSVITKDHAVNILVKLSSIKEYAENCLHLLLEQLKKAAPNQLPTYAENALPVMSGPLKNKFISVLREQLDDIEKESKRKRIEQVIKKLDK